MITADKKKRIKIVAITLLGVGAAGFGFWKWKEIQKQKQNLPPGEDSNFPGTNESYSLPKTNHSNSKGNDEFPLKQGSKGIRVKALQEALISKYGKSILPKYGADGDFGKEMVNDLKTKGYPSAIDESTINYLVKII